LKVGVARKQVARPTLNEISIRSLGVIESANVELSSGFTAITGETGAGKTMVLTALGLITGAKADADYVRTNAQRSVVSASFTIDKSVEERVLDSGGDVEDGVLNISRSVTAEGKSRITLGGALSTATKVHEISEALIEIHAQSSNARLNKPSVQRELLDSYGDTETQLVSYQEVFAAYNELAERIDSLRRELANSEKQIAALRELVEDVSKISPVTGELAEIENEINRLGSVEEIHNQLSMSLNILENEETGTLTNLKLAKKTLDSLIGKDSSLDPHLEKFGDLLYTVEDVASELVSYLARLEADPARFDYLQQRKQAINALIKKHGTGSDRTAAFEELILRYQDSEERIADLTGGSERIAELENDLADLFQDLRKAALSLSQARESAAQGLSKRITAELEELSMPNAKVEVMLLQKDSHLVSSYSSHGLDEVLFQFSPHTGSQLMPLAKIASGGEMSRLMLAIEVVIAEKSPVGTYVFDEVDAGVGGKAAVEVGKRLAKLAKSAQVIVVTHLPQVAVWADHHLVVKKDQSGSVTQSSVFALNEKERLAEIARMLSGQEESGTAQKHAEELLQMVAQSVIS
jgi:DNA repair protein RecN (Recombination protein N)